MEEKKKPEQKYSDYIDQTLNVREKYAKMWNDIEKVLDGDYEPLIGNDTEGDIRVKSHMLSTAIESDIAIAVPKPNFQYLCVPSNKREDSDVNSAETAKKIAEYYTHKLYGYENFEECAYDYFALNRAINYIGFRVDRRPETEEERVEVEVIEPQEIGPENAIFSEGGDKRDGLPYMEKVERSNFLRARGFKTIKEAWQNGGWVARRVFPNNEWVKNNPAFKKYNKNRDFKLSKYHGDVRFPNAIDPSETKTQDTEQDKDKNADLKYNIHWEIYEAPTKKHPKGQFTVFNHMQTQIIYQSEGMPVKYIDFPFKEVVDLMPRKCNWATPKSWRARDPLIAHEYYETKALKNTSFAKTVIISSESPDEWDAKIKSDKPIINLNTQSPTDAQALKVETIVPDNSAATDGSMRSRATFDNIMGRGTVDARLGRKVATEMSYNHQDFVTRMNRHKVKINKFIEECMTSMLTITKNYVTPQEQMRMTRRTDRVWIDHNEITLEGNYVITVKSSILKNMTEGERSQSLQMVSQYLTTLESMPQYAGRINGLEFVRQWVEELDFETNKAFVELESTGQYAEIAWMLSGIPAYVEPTDNHTEHMGIMDEYMMQLKEGGQRLEAEEEMAFKEHYGIHAQYLQQQGQGAQIGNPTNAMREAGGASMGNGLTMGAQ